MCVCMLQRSAHSEPTLNELVFVSICVCVFVRICVMCASLCVPLPSYNKRL